MGKRRWEGHVCEGLVLDAEIWGNLLPDIQQKLFEHLPLPALLRFQVVSKAWYNGIRNIDEVKVHGDCFVARFRGGTDALRLYSGRHHEGTLCLPESVFGMRCSTTKNGLFFFMETLGWSSRAYNLFTRQGFSIPAPPSVPYVGLPLTFVHEVGCQDGEVVVIHVVGDRSQRWMLIFESGRGTWETRPLQLPPGEELALSIGPSSHATIDGSVLYFLTTNTLSQQMSAIRSIDFKRNIDGTSSKVVSWPTLPSCYVIYRDPNHHMHDSFPFGRPFVGNIAVAGGKLIMACMRAINPGKPNLCTVALFACDKEGGKWDLVSEMPLTKELVGWRPRKDNFVEVRSHGDMLVVFNTLEFYACLYNTSTEVWSRLGRGDKDIVDVFPLKLSLK